MLVIKERRKSEAEANIQKAINHYRHSDEPSIRASAGKHGVAYSILWGRLQGRVSREVGHLKLQVLTEYGEKSIVRWYEHLDEWWHPVRMALVKGMAEAIVARRIKEWAFGKNWIMRFLSRHPNLATKLSTHLDRQRALANDPVVFKDYFNKI